MPRPLAYEEERRLKTGHLVAALALVFLGVLIGWATDGGEGSERGDRPNADVGPTDTVNGIPVGYERSREGAVAAALSYGTVVSEPAFVTNPARREQVLTAVATDEFARRYEQGAAALAELAKTPLYRGVTEGQRTVWTGAPLGYRVERYSDDEVVVFTWTVGVLGNAATTPRASFSSGQAQLRWADDDWKLAGGIDKTGPVPALAKDASTSSGNEFTRRLRDLQGLNYVP